MRTWTRLTVAALLALSLVACKQGVGERCQIDDDCEIGLICSQTNLNFSTCRTPPPPVIDAAPPPPAADAMAADATDAQPADASGDAADAM